MTTRRPKPADNRAAIAAKFGTSLKALRLYEQLGLLKPPRTAAGWRVYGEAEIERLHAILSLKQLGLPLARIAELVNGRSADLAGLLDTQEQALLQMRGEVDHALDLVRIAKVRLRNGERLSPDDLARLVRRISKASVAPSPRIEALMRDTHTPEQLATMRVRGDDAEDLARTTEGWAQVRAEIDAFTPGGDPRSDQGLDIARRAVALIQTYTRGDRELWNSSARFWRAAAADLAIAEDLPLQTPHLDFLGAAMGELRQRGEL